MFKAHLAPVSDMAAWGIGVKPAKAFSGFYKNSDWFDSNRADRSSGDTVPALGVGQRRIRGYGAIGRLSGCH